MIAIDTNILVYAWRAEADEHEMARQALARLGALRQDWAIPWPCVHEFLSVTTGYKLKAYRSQMSEAINAMQAWLSHPRCSVLGESHQHFRTLSGLCERAKLQGGAIHDARIAAICIDHGVEELWTCDRDFARFPDLRTRNPLILSLHEPAPSVYRVSPAPGSCLPSINDANERP